MQNLDEIDAGILSSLQTDARETTNTEIADEMEVSPATIGDRIDRMRSAGVIETSYTAIDYERAGFPHDLLLTCSVATAEREPAATRAMEHDGVVAVRELLTGEANLHVEVVDSSADGVSDTVRSLEELGLDVCSVEIIESERRRPFNGLERID